MYTLKIRVNIIKGYYYLESICKKFILHLFYIMWNKCWPSYNLLWKMSSAFTSKPFLVFTASQTQSRRGRNKQGLNLFCIRAEKTSFLKAAADIQKTVKSPRILSVFCKDRTLNSGAALLAAQLQEKLLIFSFGLDTDPWSTITSTSTEMITFDIFLQ